MSDCPYRVVLDGRERECTAPGEHDVHVFRDGAGQKVRFEIVPRMANVSSRSTSMSRENRWSRRCVNSPGPGRTLLGTEGTT